MGISVALQDLFGILAVIICLTYTTELSVDSGKYTEGSKSCLSPGQSQGNKDRLHAIKSTENVGMGWDGMGCEVTCKFYL